MNLFALHLASVLLTSGRQITPTLNPPPLAMNPILEDLLDEQDVARLLANAPEILTTVRCPSGQLHSAAYRMAAELIDLARFRLKDLTQRMLEDTPAGIQARRLINYAEQLAAHHLDHIERISQL